MRLKILTDVLLINISFVLAYFFRFKILLFIAPDSAPIFGHYLRVLVIVSLLWLAVFKFYGLYEEKKSSVLLDELAMLFLAISTSTLVLFSMLFLYREFWFSRLVIVNAWLVALVLLGGERTLIYWMAGILRAQGWHTKNVLLLGSGEMADVIAQKISQDKGLGYHLAGTFGNDVSIEMIKEEIKSKNIKEVIIASNDIPAPKVVDIIMECERFGIEFKIIPGRLELIASRLDVDELGGIPLLSVSEIALKGFNAFIKRAFDFISSLVGIIILSPLFLVFAGLIKITSPGPIFFMQERVGKDGDKFKMFKFRSMVKDAEQLFPQLKPLSEVDGHLFKMKNDPRITPLGRFMRRYSIDELPQIFNVLLGQMSMVGPRPPLPREVSEYSSWHWKRLRVRPGITGPWQVAGRSLLPFEEMVRLDVYYIENWSLWLDIKILLRTVPVVLLGTGAY
ncbi:MAG: sugar transferase [Candidatus Margulisbacteria bacterium]|nr:sugar transferase [Candidatus Margulisiibacteriota bacterium]